MAVSTVVDLKRIAVTAIILSVIIYATAHLTAFAVQTKNCEVISAALEIEGSQTLSDVRDKVCVFQKLFGFWDTNRAVNKTLEGLDKIQ